MNTYEIAREGEATGDGRLIEAGAVTFHDEKIPVMRRNESGGSNVFSQPSYIAGVMSNLRREGSRIFGDSDVECAAVTAEFDMMATTYDPETDTVVSHTARLRCVYAWDTDEHYPWKDET